MTTEQLPYGLQLAVNTMQAFGCGESSSAIRAEHAQRVTMQHHAADLAQQIEDLRFAAESGGRRIAELEAERDELRAKLDGIEAQEPAAVIGSGYGIHYVGAEPISVVVERHGLKVGSPLYASPVPAQTVPDGWRPIAAEPADGGLYWVLIGDQPHVARFSNRTSSAKWWNAYGITRAVAKEPTHWMPIPDAPERKA